MIRSGEGESFNFVDKKINQKCVKIKLISFLGSYLTQYFLFKQEMRPHITLTFNKELGDRKGKILSFDFNKTDEPPIELPLKNFNRTGFNPHGISLYRDPSTGVVSLFVINHRAGEQVVEIFDFDRQTHSLIHRRSVIDELIWSPNNLYALGKTSIT